MIVSADIGGTKTSIALSATNSPVSYTKEHTYLNKNFTSFSEIVEEFVGSQEIEIMVLGIAGPINSRKVDLTNLDWLIDADMLATKFACAVYLLNDLEASAHHIPHLHENMVEELYAGGHNDSQVEVLVAVGTGLGVAKLAHSTNITIYPSEAGHIGFSPKSEFQYQFYNYLQQKNKHVSNEMIVSTIGFRHLPDFLRKNNYFEFTKDFLDQIDISSDLTRLFYETSKEHTADGKKCQELLEEYSFMVGAFLGDMGLVHLPRTIYLTGGIGRNILDPDKIVEGFLVKANMQQVVEQISVVLIKDPDCGLHGASYYAADHL